MWITWHVTRGVKTGNLVRSIFFLFFSCLASSFGVLGRPDNKMRHRMSGQRVSLGRWCFIRHSVSIQWKLRIMSDFKTPPECQSNLNSNLGTKLFGASVLVYCRYCSYCGSFLLHSDVIKFKFITGRRVIQACKVVYRMAPKIIQPNFSF